MFILVVFMPLFRGWKVLVTNGAGERWQSFDTAQAKLRSVPI